jgi:glycosyltransferase involved in cell wall biosynthesis
MMLSSLNILYISYAHGFSRPHLHSQILPHIERLSMQGFAFTILTSEPNQPNDVEQTRLTETSHRLKQAAVTWIDFEKLGLINAIRQSCRIAHKIKKEGQLDLIHARGIASGFIASILKLVLRRPWLYDPRIVYSDTSVEMGKIRKKSLRYYIFKYLDIGLVLWADIVRVESDNHRQWYLRRLPIFLREKVKFVVDVNSVDTEQFQVSLKDRQNIREELKISQDQAVIAYSGSMLDGRNGVEMCRFVRELAVNGQEAFFLVISHENNRKIADMLATQGITAQRSFITSLSHTCMPAYLSAADAAVVFLKSPVWAYSFPLKLSEYLAMELPVVLNHGFGGAADLIEQHQAGVVLHGLDEQEMQAGRDKLVTLLENRAETQKKCRLLALNHLSVDKSASRLMEAYLSVCKSDIKEDTKA